MKIYFAHSTNFDFKNDFYQPFNNSVLVKSHELIFPHKTGQFINSKEIIKNVDLVIAEISYPSTGLGIELGWAEVFETPIIAVYRAESRISKSLEAVTGIFISYNDSEQMTKKVQEFMKSHYYRV